MTPTNEKTTRVLIVLPSWIGDAVMATPALRVIRDSLPGAFIGGLAKPGIDEILAGTDFLDELHVDSRAGVMGVKRAAGKVRPRRYDAALLMTNSFSTALLARVAGIRRRIGFDRDGRGLMLTDKLQSHRRRDVSPFSSSSTDPNAWAPIAACEHYRLLATALLGVETLETNGLLLATTDAEERRASEILATAGFDPSAPRAAMLNPGGNNPAKRWPVDRFIAIGKQLRDEHDLGVLVNGAPGEREMTEQIAEGIGDRAVSLAALGMRLGDLKAICRRSSIMLTNDTGPRHIAAAFGIPVISLFGPTDHRWTTIPVTCETIVLADPTLPEREVANDHPERCAIDRIDIERVSEAVRAAL